MTTACDSWVTEIERHACTPGGVRDYPTLLSKEVNFRG
jgi:hypothetical protein